MKRQRLVVSVKPRSLIIAMEKLFLLVFALLSHSATAFVENLDQVHRLAMEGNLTRFVHVKMMKGGDQESALAGLLSVLNDETDLGPGRRRRLTGVEQPRRLFRPAGGNEAKHAAYGLDLWFKIAVASDDDDVVEAGLAVEEALTRFQSDDDCRGMIEHAEASLPPELLHRANDPYRNVQGYLDTINLDAAHDITAGSSDVVVAVIDSGLDLRHPDFHENIWVNDGEICENYVDDDNNGYVDDCYGYNFYDDEGGGYLLEYGEYNHGTACSGIIAAKNDNGIGISSIAGGKNGAEGVKIMTATVQGRHYYGRGMEEAIVYAADMGARISSNSWRTRYTRQSVNDAIDYATDAGCIVVFAAGNSGSLYSSYSGHYHKAITVGALNPDGTRASYSTFGFNVDISAPGSFMYSTQGSSSYGFESGTSMACAIVAGVLALGFSANPGISNDAALRCLYSTAKNVDSINPGYENYLGAGLVDAFAFLQCIVAPTLPPTSTPLDPSSISCDFEDPYLCGWTTGNTDGESWTRWIGSSWNHDTGPNDSDGYYMYANSEFQYDVPYELTSPPFVSGGATYTVSFDVHMYGERMGVLIFQYYDGLYWRTMWTQGGDQGSQWFRVSDVLLPSSAKRVRFLAYSGYYYDSDIAIDNVAFATPAPSVSPTSAPSPIPTPAPSEIPN